MPRCTLAWGVRRRKVLKAAAVGEMVTWWYPKGYRELNILGLQAELKLYPEYQERFTGLPVKMQFVPPKFKVWEPLW